MKLGGAVYILTNKNKTTLYVGVTSELLARIPQHKLHYYKGSFSDKYNCEFIIYYELYSTIEEAIAREKQIKKYRREKKELLINSMNPEWRDLWEDIKKLVAPPSSPPQGEISTLLLEISHQRFPRFARPLIRNDGLHSSCRSRRRKGRNLKTLLLSSKIIDKPHPPSPIQVKSFHSQLILV
jgi:putative endonuclease